MSKLKNGDRCYVSTTSASAALEGQVSKVFIGFGVDGRAVCQSALPSTVPWEYTVSWEYAVPIPAKKVIPYTFETWPRGAVYLRFQKEEARNHYLVVSVGENYVTIVNGKYTFRALQVGGWEMSTDFCESWTPCSQGVDE